MFNSLSSYLFGTYNGEATDGVEETTVRLTSVMTEGDWVLVDRDSEGNSESGSSCEDNWDDYPLTNRLSRQSTRNNSTISLPCAIMEESWFVTPPPCFTCTEPILMETSPLENLLIEHPSMSVYHQHSFPIRPLTPIKETKSERLTRSLRQEITERKEAVYAVKRPKDAMSHNKKQEREHVIQEPLLIRPHVVKAQKVSIYKASRSLTQKYLERSNKAREVNQRKQHQQRSKRSRGALCSYANNNRKC